MPTAVPPHPHPPALAAAMDFLSLQVCLAAPALLGDQTWVGLALGILDARAGQAWPGPGAGRWGRGGGALVQPQLLWPFAALCYFAHLGRCPALVLCVGRAVLIAQSREPQKAPVLFPRVCWAQRPSPVLLA